MYMQIRTYIYCIDECMLLILIFIYAYGLSNHFSLTIPSVSIIECRILMNQRGLISGMTEFEHFSHSIQGCEKSLVHPLFYPVRCVASTACWVFVSSGGAQVSWEIPNEKFNCSQKSQPLFPRYCGNEPGKNNTYDMYIYILYNRWWFQSVQDILFARNTPISPKHPTHVVFRNGSHWRTLPKMTSKSYHSHKLGLEMIVDCSVVFILSLKMLCLLRCVDSSTQALSA